MGEEKKDRYRFTVRFDCDDNLHRQAAEILAGMGRKKARYLAQAVCFYEQNRREGKEREAAVSASRNRYVRSIQDGATEKVSRMDNPVAVADNCVETCTDKEAVAIMKNGMNAFRRR